jgi:hypothetical protein
LLRSTAGFSRCGPILNGRGIGSRSNALDAANVHRLGDISAIDGSCY